MLCPQCSAQLLLREWQLTSERPTIWVNLSKLTSSNLNDENSLSSDPVEQASYLEINLCQGRACPS